MICVHSKTWTIQFYKFPSYSFATLLSDFLPLKQIKLSVLLLFPLLNLQLSPLCSRGKQEGLLSWAPHWMVLNIVLNCFMTLINIWHAFRLNIIFFYFTRNTPLWGGERYNKGDFVLSLVHVYVHLRKSMNGNAYFYIYK